MRSFTSMGAKEARMAQRFMRTRSFSEKPISLRQWPYYVSRLTPARAMLSVLMGTAIPMSSSALAGWAR